MIGEREMWDEKTERRAGGEFMKRIKKRQKYVIVPVISHGLSTSCSILEEDSSPVMKMLGAKVSGT